MKQSNYLSTVGTIISAITIMLLKNKLIRDETYLFNVASLCFIHTVPVMCSMLKMKYKIKTRTSILVYSIVLTIVSKSIMFVLLNNIYQIAVNAEISMKGVGLNKQK